MTSYKLAKVSNGLSENTARLHFADLGLKLLDWRIIVALRHEGPATAAEIAQLIEADKGNVSRSISALTAQGLVRRSATPGALRQRRLELTNAGDALFARLNPIARERERQLLSVLTPDERAAFDALLDKLLEQLVVMARA
ncbi:MAG: MarR family winged helix-turn-helix transcriptional regulator [Lautropia sp.]